MEKVKVSKEIAEGLEQAFYIYRNRENKDECILNHTINGIWVEEVAVLHQLEILRLAEILIKGYEVEETPEEKILYYYNQCKINYTKDKTDFYVGYWEGVMDGIKKTSNTLGIKIKGIND